MNAAVPQQIEELAMTSSDVGSMLRNARQRAGLSADDVAQQLNLGREVIDALESNDMEKLPPAAFVRGYLRSYGKLLELDVPELLAVLDGEGLVDPDIAPVNGIAREGGGSDPLMRWMSLAVICVLGVMVVIWWQTKNGETPVVAETPTSSEVAQSPELRAVQQAEQEANQLAQAPAPPAASEQSAAAPAETEIAVAVTELPQAEAMDETSDAAATTAVETTEFPAATLEDDPEAPTAAAEVSAATDAASGELESAEPAATSSAPVANGSAIEDSPAEPVPTGDPPMAALLADEQAATSSATIDETAVAAATEQIAQVTQVNEGETGEHELLLMFDGASWTEIVDASGAQLFYGLYDSPAPLRITGQFPFTVFLGNSPAVTLLANGETHDQSLFNRSNNTARFILDEAGLRRP